jgi:CheY-like chemotaxis protein
MYKILIVAAEVGTRKKISTYVKTLGHQVIQCITTTEAVRASLREEPDLILIDNNLPGENIKDFVAEIRSDSFIGQVPFICITDKSSFGEIESLLSTGITSVIRKPVKLNQLSNRIDEALGIADGDLDSDLAPPEILKNAYDEILSHGKTIGDTSEVFAGITTRDNKKYMAEIKKTERWFPVITEHDIEPFFKEHDNKYVFYEPRMFLSTPPEDLIENERVVVKRSAPPLCAAVEKDGLLCDMSVYNISPAKGLCCEYIAAYLNSRLMDYFIRRIRPLTQKGGLSTMLRIIDLQDIPVIIPDPQSQEAIAELVWQYEGCAMAPRMESRRAHIMAAINKGIFEINGFNKEHVDKLTSLSF